MWWLGWTFSCLNMVNTACTTGKYRISSSSLLWISLSGLQRQSPDLNSFKHLGMSWNADFEPARTSVLDLTPALVADWEQLPAARLQNQEKIFKEGLEAVVLVSAH